MITEEQYNWAVARVEQLLPVVTDETPLTSPESIELQILSNLVADYSDEHFSIGDLPSTNNNVVYNNVNSRSYANA